MVPHLSFAGYIPENDTPQITQTNTNKSRKKCRESVVKGTK